MNTQTIEKMKQLKLHGMVRAFRTSLETGSQDKLSPDEFISLLIESEWDERQNRRLEQSIKNARFRYKSSIEQLSFDMERNLDKNQVMRLADCDYIKKKENILITGSTGIGKSYLASAFGHHACSVGYKVLYQQSTKLFARLKIAKADGSYLKEISKMERVDLIVIDDFGIQPLDSQCRTSFLEIMEDRHEKGSTIITSQLPVNKWHEAIGEQTIADAIMDRIIHNAHRIDMRGDSLRKKKIIEENKN
jgi:DNA replication protein DnaC